MVMATGTTQCGFRNFSGENNHKRQQPVHLLVWSSPESLRDLERIEARDEEYGGIIDVKSVESGLFSGVRLRIGSDRL